MSQIILIIITIITGQDGAVVFQISPEIYSSQPSQRLGVNIILAVSIVILVEKVKLEHSCSQTWVFNSCIFCLQNMMPYPLLQTQPMCFLFIHSSSELFCIMKMSSLLFVLIITKINKLHNIITADRYL